MITKRKWTGKIPAQSGFYWNAEPDMSDPYCCFWDEASLTLAREGALWFGPVKPPPANKRKGK